MNFSYLILTILIFKKIYCSEWDYEGKGPDVWVHEYSACRGRLQSPINIDQSRAVYSEKLSHFNFFNYEKLFMWNITDNGHTILGNQINDLSIIPYITGSNFKQNEKFYLHQFHFHWGQNIFQGSEHHINSEKFPLELHLVHKSNSNKLAVLAFIFQIGENNNKKLDSLLESIRLIVENGYHVKKLTLSSIIPDVKKLNDEGYFRYEGSLTTPPCTEGVIWSLFLSKVNISKNQMENFYINKVDKNMRDVQQLYNRTLLISVKKVISSPINPDLINPIQNLISNLFDFIIKMLSSMVDD